MILTRAVARRINGRRVVFVLGILFTLAFAVLCRLAGVEQDVLRPTTRQ